MRNNYMKYTIALLGLFTFGTSVVQAEIVIPKPNEMLQTTQNFIPQAPHVNAKGYIIADARSGKVIAEQNSKDRMEPASLTKLMTLYIAFSSLENGRIKLTDMVRVSQNAAQMQGSKMFLKPGESVSVENLIQGIIVDSGNDACVALAEYIAGGEDAFSSLMNQQAQALGMKNSHFTDSTGLPNQEHYTTPYDMTILAAALVQNFPEYYKWFSAKYFTYNGIKQSNRNRLLWRDPYVDGLKTGHTSSAGYCLIASAQKDSTRLVSVLLGASSDEERMTETQSLLTYGFRFFESRKVYSANDALEKAQVWFGSSREVPVGVSHDVYALVPTGQYERVKPTIELNDKITAPVAQFQQVGVLKLKLNEQVIATEPVVALKEVAKGGMWDRMMDSISLSFHKMF